MNIKNNVVYKSLLIMVMAVIFLCASVGIGFSTNVGYDRTTKVVQAEENPVYAAYIKNGGNSALYQLSDKQQSSVYMGKYNGTPVKWSILQNGTMNNGAGTMLYSKDKNLASQLYYQYFNMSNSAAYGYNTWSTSHIRSFLNGTPYARNPETLEAWNGNTLIDTIFGTSSTLRDKLLETYNSTMIYYDNDTFFNANGSHLNSTYINTVQDNYATTKAAFGEKSEYTYDYLFLLGANDITADNGFTFMDDSGNLSPTNIVQGQSVNRNSVYVAHADGVKVGSMDLRNSVKRGVSATARMMINSNSIFDSVTTNPMTNYQVAMNVSHSDFIFAISGSPESGWVNGTVASSQGNRPAYKLYLKNGTDIGSTSGMFPTSAYVLRGKLYIDLSASDGNNYINKYMLVVKDEAGNVVSSRSVNLGDYQGSSAIALDSSVLENGLLKDGYTLETFGYKSASGNELSYCTDKAVVQITNKKHITLSLNNLTYNPDNSSYEVEARVYGNSYNPVIATAIETDFGVEVSPYDYVIQYNDEDLSGEWTTTVPTSAGRYAVRAYGAPSENYMEAVSDVAYLVINPRPLTVNFIDDYKISNTEGGTRPYNGQPYKIRVEFTNLVGSDTLTAITSGGNQIDASDTPYRFYVYGYSAGTATLKDNYSFTNISYPYAITRASITIVWSNLTVTYDGTQKDPSVAWESAAVMPVSDPEVVFETRINAGNYGVTAEYNGADADNFTITNPMESFTINKATATIAWSDLTVKYDGTQKNPSAAWETAEVVPIGTPTVNSEERINAGYYAVTVTYDGADKYNFTFVNATETMTIERVKLWISLSGRAYYGQEAILRPMVNTGMSDTIPSDEMTEINAALATVTLETNWTTSSPMGQSYYVIVAGYNQTVYHDYNLMPNYDFEFHKATFYPMKAQINSIEWSENDYTYNGTVQTITATGSTGYGQVITLEITVNKEFKNAAADYIATASISAADATNFDFAYGVAKTKGYEIKKATATIVWSSLTAIYDGTQKDPTAVWGVAAVMPESAPAVVYAERINAGSFAVNAEYNGADKDNFTITNTTATLVISPIELVISWSDANGGTKVYDGTEYTVSATFTNLVSGDTLIPVITGDNGVNASETPYVKTITGFTAENGTVAENYVLPSTGCDYNYTIIKRNVSVSWTNISFTYNAQAQKPTATWTDTVALNAGSDLVVSGEQVNASDTAYTATAAITGADATNFTITNDTQSFTIGKRTAIVLWTANSFVYDGTPKSAKATWWKGDIFPIGEPTVNHDEMINAGTYSAIATYDGADKDNFTITYNETVAEIRKVSLSISLNGYANYGQEAVLSYSIIEEYSGNIPESERDFVFQTLNGVDLETDWTPTGTVGESYYVMIAGYGHLNYYGDEDLLENYSINWYKGYFTAGIATIVSIEWNENDYTYNGAVQVITAQGKTANDVVIDLEISVNKEFKNAANDYIATAAISSADTDNFEFDSGVITTTKSYEIKKATATIVWSGLTCTYDGTQKDPTAVWENTAVMPESAPTVVDAERINAGSFAVNAEYNGADKDNFTITNTTATLVINRAEIEVVVMLDEDVITFGSEMQAHVGAVWLLSSEETNNALLKTLITGYMAGDNVGTYLITLDFDKAEDENRRSPMTFLDNYEITVINAATLTVNRKAITSGDLANWINGGDVIFNGKTVLEDGNVHMIYAQISGEAAEFIEVIAYKDKDGVDFDGASLAGNYGITALISSVNENYDAQDITLTARLRISVKTAIIDENGEIRGYIVGLDPDYEYTATLMENHTEAYSEQVGENGVEMVITITDENGNPAIDDELTYIVYPPNGYDADTGAMYIVNGGTLESLSGTYDGNGGIGFNAQTDNGVITLIASNIAEGLNINGWFFWPVIAGTTLCGFIVIVILIRKIREEYAEK